MQPQCIYCRTTTGSFKKGEHVIPQAFGKFGPETWVLHDIVCDDCNSHFDKAFEVYFNRSSLEAIERFNWDLKSRKEANHIHGTRVSTISVSAPSKGIKFSPVSHELLPQAGFQIAGQSGREFFTVEELESMKDFDKSKYDLKSVSGILLMTKDENSYNRLVGALARIGITFTQRSEAPPLGAHRVELEYVVKIDQINMRAVAKIAFNYMAQVRGAVYCLRSDFDSIRGFIRNGVRPVFTPVTPSNTPILAYDTETKRQTASHIIVLETKDNGSTIQSRVSLFNGVTYTVTLAKFFSGVFSKPDGGHCFDFQRKKVEPLRTGRKTYRFF